MDFEAAKALCRSFPGCTEDTKWDNDTVFSVGAKMFAVSCTRPATDSNRNAAARPDGA